MASSSFAAAGHFGMEYVNMISGTDPTNGMSGFYSMGLGAPIIIPTQKVGVVYDITDALSLIGGICLTQSVAGDVSPLDYGDAANGTGIGVGVKYRLGKGTLVPVVGVHGYLLTSSIPDITLNASLLSATFGFEYSIVPGLLLIGDATVIDQWSGYLTGDGDSAILDHTTRVLPGCSVGLRWYVI